MGKQGLRADGGECGLCLSRYFCWSRNRLGMKKIRDALAHAEAVSKELHSEPAVFAPPYDRHVNGERHVVMGEVYLQGEIRSCLDRHVALQSATVAERSKRTPASAPVSLWMPAGYATEINGWLRRCIAGPLFCYGIGIVWEIFTFLVPFEPVIGTTPSPLFLHP